MLKKVPKGTRHKGGWSQKKNQPHNKKKVKPTNKNKKKQRNKNQIQTYNNF